MTIPVSTEFGHAAKWVPPRGRRRRRSTLAAPRVTANVDLRTITALPAIGTGRCISSGTARIAALGAVAIREQVINERHAARHPR